jgi:transposase
VFFMAKYSERFKLKVVHRYLAGKAGAKALSKQTGVGHGHLRRWIAAFRAHGQQGLRKQFSHYSADFKLNVLRVAERQGLSNTQAAARFDLRGGGGVVGAWRRRYDEGGLPALHPKPRGRPPKKMPKTKPIAPAPAPEHDTRTVEVLRQENEALRAEVAYLKKLQALVRADRQAAPKGRKPSLS